MMQEPARKNEERPVRSYLYHDQDPVSYGAERNDILEERQKDERTAKPGSPWLDPRFLLPAFLTVAAIIAGYAAIAAEASSSRATLAIQAAKLEASVGRIEAAVGAHSADLAAIRQDVAARGRELDSLKEDVKVQAQWLQKQNQDIARLQAKTGG